MPLENNAGEKRSVKGARVKNVMLISPNLAQH